MQTNNKVLAYIFSETNAFTLNSPPIILCSILPRSPLLPWYNLFPLIPIMYICWVRIRKQNLWCCPSYLEICKIWFHVQFKICLELRLCCEGYGSNDMNSNWGAISKAICGNNPFVNTSTRKIILNEWMG